MQLTRWKSWISLKSLSWVLASAAILFGVKTLQDPTAFNKYIRSIANVATNCSAPLDPPVTFEALKSHVSDCNIHSIEDTLQALPPTYRSSFALMRKSKSAQDASPDNPRVIMFGSDARFVISFNGDPSQKGYNELEAIQFNDQSKQFEFHQIGFAPTKNKAALFDADIHSCTSCHRDPARPNWEAYDVWEGAYGQVEDQIKIGSEEDQAFQGFLKRSRNKGRYRYLVGSEDLRAPSIEEIAGYVTKEKATAYSIATAPNFRLTFFFNLLNYQRLAEEIKKTPDFETFKYAYYGALFGCDPIDEFIPIEVSSRFSATYSQVLEDTAQKLANQYAVRMKADGPFDNFTVFNHDKGPENFEAVSASRYIIAKLRYLTEGRGMSMEDWSLSPTPNAYIFSDGELYLKEIARSFETELKQTEGLKLDYVNLDEADLEPLFGVHAKDFTGAKRLSCCNYDGSKPASSSYGSDNCSILKNLSVQAFQGKGTFATSQNVASHPPEQEGFHRKPEESVNTCIGCHRTGNGSGLVFKDLATLKNMLGQAGFPHGTLQDEIQFRLTTAGDGKMPPYNGLMSDDERASLADFLKAK